MIETETLLPVSFQHDVERAVTLLRAGGCAEVFLFGSAATGQLRDGSDLDLAVRGCPPGQFFQLWGTLLLNLNHVVDLVDLDAQDPFAQMLEQQATLVPIG